MRASADATSDATRSLRSDTNDAARSHYFDLLRQLRSAVQAVILAANIGNSCLRCSDGLSLQLFNVVRSCLLAGCRRTPGADVAANDFLLLLIVPEYSGVFSRDLDFVAYLCTCHAAASFARQLFADEARILHYYLDCAIMRDEELHLVFVSSLLALEPVSFRPDKQELADLCLKASLKADDEARLVPWSNPRSDCSDGRVGDTHIKDRSNVASLRPSAAVPRPDLSEIVARGLGLASAAAAPKRADAPPGKAGQKPSLFAAFWGRKSPAHAVPSRTPPVSVSRPPAASPSGSVSASSKLDSDNARQPGPAGTAVRPTSPREAVLAPPPVHVSLDSGTANDSDDFMAPDVGADTTDAHDSSSVQNDTKESDDGTYSHDADSADGNGQPLDASAIGSGIADVHAWVGPASRSGHAGDPLIRMFALNSDANCIVLEDLAEETSSGNESFGLGAVEDAPDARVGSRDAEREHWEQATDAALAALFEAAGAPSCPSAQDAPIADDLREFAAPSEVDLVAPFVVEGGAAGGWRAADFAHDPNVDVGLAVEAEQIPESSISLNDFRDLKDLACSGTRRPLITRATVEPMVAVAHRRSSPSLPSSAPAASLSTSLREVCGINDFIGIGSDARSVHADEQVGADGCPGGDGNEDGEAEDGDEAYDAVAALEVRWRASRSDGARQLLRSVGAHGVGRHAAGGSVASRPLHTLALALGDNSSLASSKGSPSQTSSPRGSLLCGQEDGMSDCDSEHSSGQRSMSSSSASVLGSASGELSSGGGLGWRLKTQPRLPQATQISLQRGLCPGCRERLPSAALTAMLGGPRYCHYIGAYFCPDCHQSDLRPIPARIAERWDFEPKKVSTAAAMFLDAHVGQPLVPITRVRRTKLPSQSVLTELHALRRQFSKLKELSGQRSCLFLELLIGDLSRDLEPHVAQGHDLYSLQDLIRLHLQGRNAQVFSSVQRLVSASANHVEFCDLCSQDGQYCPICASDRKLYTFEVDQFYACPSCGAGYHKSCWDRAACECPRCFYVPPTDGAGGCGVAGRGGSERGTMSRMNSSRTSLSRTSIAEVQPW